MCTKTVVYSKKEGPGVRPSDLLRELVDLSQPSLDYLSTEDIHKCVTRLVAADRVFIVGVGHSGLFARIMAMKLCHVGLSAHTVMTETAPPYGPGSILIAVSQSGETETVVGIARKAIRMGGSVIAITANRESSLGLLAAETLEVVLDSGVSVHGHLATFGDGSAQNVRGVAFGLALYAISYSLAVDVARTLGLSPVDIDLRHANLE
jgi:6-phospho-3-hexuloisomerase